MKVILIKDVARLGRRSEVKEVPSGHAINFLIPRKLAIPGTPENIKRLSAEIEKQDLQKQNTQKMFDESLARLSTKSVVCSVEANEQGNLYKGINVDDIAKLLESEYGGVSKDHIVLKQPIKHVGTHTIELIDKHTKRSFQLEVIKK